MLDRILLAACTLEIAGPPELALYSGLRLEIVEQEVLTLTEAGILDRIWLPLEPSEPGRWVSALTRKGARLVREVFDEQYQGLRKDDMASLFLHHRLAVSQVVAALAATLGHSPLWSAGVGRSLHSSLREFGARSRYSPDACIVFCSPQGAGVLARHVFVEVDRSTESSRQLVRKLRLLDEYYLADHKRIFQTDRLLVVFTVPSAERQELVSTLVRQGYCRVRILIARHSVAVDPHQAMSCWLDCRTDKSASLLDPLGSGVSGE